MIAFDDIAAALAAHGLIPRGGFHPVPADGVPGEPATLVLAGNVGPAMWRSFEKARHDEPDPLDAWTRRVLTGIAASLGASPLFPFEGPPWLPFQRWAMKGDAVHPSPIGALIHPDYGLWHAYRGALAFRERIDLPAKDRRASPCDDCKEKPCLKTCPVGAFSTADFCIPFCVEWLTSDSGKGCINQGCRARRACPVGTRHHYDSPQATHHMTHFLNANLGTKPCES